MSNYNIEKEYVMKFEHNYAYGELELFKENTDTSSYWINAVEHFKDENEDSKFVAIKFSNDDLIRLRDTLNKLDLL